MSWFISAHVHPLSFHIHTLTHTLIQGIRQPLGPCQTDSCTSPTTVLTRRTQALRPTLMRRSVKDTSGMVELVVYTRYLLAKALLPVENMHLLIEQYCSAAFVNACTCTHVSVWMLVSLSAGDCWLCGST